MQTISARGFAELVDGWIDLIQDVIEDTETKKTELFDPFEHKLVVRLLPDYLEQIDALRAEIARLEADKEAFEQQEREEDDSDEAEEEGEHYNYAKALEEEKKSLKAQAKDGLDRIKYLQRGPGVKDKGSIAALKKLGQDTSDLERELAALVEEVAPVQHRIDRIDTLLAPYVTLKQQVAATRKQLKDLSRALLQVLRTKRDQLSADDCRDLVLDLSRDSLEQVLRRYIEEHRQEVRAAVENLWNKYGESLRVIQSGRDEAAERLEGFLKELGYV